MFEHDPTGLHRYRFHVEGVQPPRDGVRVGERRDLKRFAKEVLRCGRLPRAVDTAEYGDLWARRGLCVDGEPLASHSRPAPGERRQGDRGGSVRPRPRQTPRRFRQRNRDELLRYDRTCESPIR